MAKMMRGVKGARSLFLCYKRGDKTFESDIRTWQGFAYAQRIRLADWSWVSRQGSSTPDAALRDGRLTLQVRTPLALPLSLQYILTLPLQGVAGKGTKYNAHARRLP